MNMKAIVINLILMFFINISLNAQNYTCEKLQSDIDTWNTLKSSNNIKWANAIKDKGLYNTNSDGSFEYVYIMQTTDSINISTLRKIGFDFFEYAFNIGNSTRADVETNSPSDGVIYKGLIERIGAHSGIHYNQINANIYFDIRFKPNRIRFSVKIQDYQVIKTYGASIIENQRVFVKDCYPIKQDSNHQKSYAMAFINSNSDCLNYAHNFLNYLNKHIKESQPTQIEDW